MNYDDIIINKTTNARVCACVRLIYYDIEKETDGGKDKNKNQDDDDDDFHLSMNLIRK